VSLSSGLWATWAAIAIRAEAAAIGSREQLEREYPHGDWNRMTTAELEASLVAVSGSAIAIDGLFGVIKPKSGIEDRRVQQWKAQQIARHSRIFEVFQSCLVLGSATNRWPQQLQWLFSLRNDNLHFSEAFLPPAVHPVLGNTTLERATYTSENASKAVDVLVDVLTRVVDHPKQTADPEFVDFTRRWKIIVQSLLALRDELKRDRELPDHSKE